MTTDATAVLLAVNVVHELIRGPTRWTAIDKRPVHGAVQVGVLGLAGDRQCDTRYHGGPDKALYAYAVEDAEWWAAELGREIPPGLFGENLTTRGLDITGASIGGSVRCWSRYGHRERRAGTCPGGWGSSASINGSLAVGERVFT